MNHIFRFNEFIKEGSESGEGFFDKVYNALTNSDDFLKKTATLMFDGSELHWLVEGQVKKSWDGISGNTVMSTMLNGKRHDKSSETHGAKFQQDKNEGPLPEGKYYIERLQEQNRKNNSTLSQYYNYLFTDDVNKANFHGKGGKFAWGDYRMMINPYRSTNTYGRDNFYIHGGSIAGSGGCIDLTDEMEDFAKTYLAYISHKNKPRVELLVKYKK
jgi:hypothetical protein